MILIKNVATIKRKSYLQFILIISQNVFSLKIQIEVFCYGLLLQKLLEYLDIGNKVEVAKERNSIEVGITIIVPVLNRVKYSKNHKYDFK